MPRAFGVYDLPRGPSADPHVQATSTGTANVQTLTPPPSAKACFIDVETNGIRFTLDGTTPDATNGLTLAVNDGPFFLPLAKPIAFVSQAAANAICNVLWLE
jgi:hypothetical protein